MCKYCSNIPKGIILYGTVMFKNTYKNYDEYKGKWYDVKYSGEVFINKEIKYCPMCGCEIIYVEGDKNGTD